MAIIKKHYCEAVEPLDVNLLDLQMCIFKLTMKT
jgi:hypothetical protein